MPYLLKFWDASAVVPLLVAEAETNLCRNILSEDSEIVVWYFTAVEVVSALNRRVRERRLKTAEFRKAKEQLQVLEHAGSEVTSVDDVRARARLVLEKYPLRAADALQLSAR